MHRSVEDMHAPKLEDHTTSGEDLENIRIKIRLILNDDNYGTQYLSSLPYPGKFYHR